MAVWASGLELEDGSGNIAFAIHQNAEIMAARGNQVNNGLDVTANVSSNLTTTANDIDIAAGAGIANGVYYSYPGGSIDLSNAYDDLAAGQSLYVLIYIDSAGAISDPTDGGGNEGVGTPATTGQQLPPSLPEDATPLALVILTNGDTTVDAADIEDYIIYTPDGAMYGDNKRIYRGSDGDAFDYHDGLDWYFDETTGSIIHIVETDTENFIVRTNGGFQIQDYVGSVLLFDLDVDARTWIGGNASNPLAYTQHGSSYDIYLTGDFTIYDTDDSNVALLKLITGAGSRAFTVGDTSDTVDTSLYGELTLGINARTDGLRIKTLSSSPTYGYLQGEYIGAKFFIMHNLYHDGSNWNKDDITYGGLMYEMVLSTTDTSSYYTWYVNTSTSNPATSFTTLMALNGVGQLQIPITGSSAGLLLGGDVQLYRSAANELTIPDKIYGNNFEATSAGGSAGPAYNISNMLDDVQVNTIHFSSQLYAYWPLWNAYYASGWKLYDDDYSAVGIKITDESISFRRAAALGGGGTGGAISEPSSIIAFDLANAAISGVLDFGISKNLPFQSSYIQYAGTISLVSTDEYLASAGSGSTEAVSIPVELASTIQTVTARIALSAPAASATLTVYLQELTDGGTWTTVTSGSASTSTTGTSTITVSPSFTYSTVKSYRIFIEKIHNSGASSSFNVYAVSITY